MLPFLVEDLGQGVLFFGLLASVYSLGQFFAAPVLGAMSDRI
jgi:MFS family permease